MKSTWEKEEMSKNRFYAIFQSLDKLCNVLFRNIIEVYNQEKIEK